MRPAFVAALRVAMAAILFGGCGTGDTEEPDLVPTSVREHCSGGASCYPLQLEVCLENLGEGDASNFDVTVNDSVRTEVAALAAGQEACVDIEYSLAAAPN